MRTHLSVDEMTEFMAGVEASPGAAEHLASCVSCRRQMAVLRQFVADRRTAMEDESPDWSLQRESVMSRLPDAAATVRPAARWWLRPVLVAAAVLVIAVGLRLAMPPGVVTPTPSEDLPVEEILAEVDEVLADDSVPGFESIDPGFDDPASLFENGTS